MKISEAEEQIDNKYLIMEKISSDNTGNVFLVKEKGKLYIAKIFKDDEESLYDNEIKIIKTLKDKNNPYITNIIDSGEGDIIIKNKKTKKSKYCINEYASHGNIFDYIYCKKKGFGEFYTKVLFSKIIKGIKFLHSLNICHRNLKLENIQLDENFCPKISNYGFASMNTFGINATERELIDKAPEVNEGDPYDGIKTDIFYLGTGLMLLTIGIHGFKTKNDEDKYCKKIKNEEIESFWELFNGITLSNEFKDLYTKMVSYNPKKRLTAEEILKHDWFKEINEINEEQMNNLENEINKELLKLSDIVKMNNQREMETVEREYEPCYTTRTIHDDENEFFYECHIRPKKIYTSMIMNNFIKIKGYINPKKFMNNLCRILIIKFGSDSCFIEANQKELKFTVIFEEEETIEESKEENEIGVLTIKVILYEYSDDYILTFIRKEGNRFSFLDKFEAISELVKYLIC